MTKPGYINATFRSSRKNEAYFFINDQLLLLSYEPGPNHKDMFLYGPGPVGDGFKPLDHTIFASYGIDCSFDTDTTEAFIFCKNFCALVDYSPCCSNFRIIKGPKTIIDMFPFFKDTVFEHGIDAALRSCKDQEVYLFKDKSCAHIDYGTNSLLQAIQTASGFWFDCFHATVFENGIDAVFASHREHEAYFFKDEYCARVYYDPDTQRAYIMRGGVAPIRNSYFPTLGGIIPLNN